jgi:hypothetical protein
MLKKIVSLIKILPFFLLVREASSSEAWKIIKEEKGIKIYEMKKAKEGWTSFKAIGNFKYKMKKIIKVILDFDHKHLWAPQNKFSKIMKKLKNGNYLVLEHYKAPWPVDNREFLFEGFVKRNNDNEVLIHAWSNTSEPYKNDDVVIAFAQYVDINVKKLGEKESEVTFSVSGHLGGWLPNWIKGFVRTKWPIQFFRGLKKELGKSRDRNPRVFNELPFSL